MTQNNTFLCSIVHASSHKKSCIGSHDCVTPYQHAITISSTPPPLKKQSGNTRRWPNGGLMLVQRRRRWPTIGSKSRVWWEGNTIRKRGALDMRYISCHAVSTCVNNVKWTYTHGTPHTFCYDMYITDNNATTDSVIYCLAKPKDSDCLLEK